MTDQEKCELAVGRWELWKSGRYFPPGYENALKHLASKVMDKQFGLERKDMATMLTGDQMLFRTNLAIALHECGVSIDYGQTRDSREVK